MRKDIKIVKVSTSKKLSWPQFCVLCLKESTKEDFELFSGSGHVPYCDNCYTRVNRLRNWKDNLFGIALIIGALGAIGGIIVTIIEKGWLELLRVQNWLLIGGAGLIFMGIAYTIMWLLLLPFRLIFRSKLAKLGVKILKSKKQGVTILKFFNPEYAKIFRKANEIAILT